MHWSDRWARSWSLPLFWPRADCLHQFTAAYNHYSSPLPYAPQKFGRFSRLPDTATTVLLPRPFSALLFRCVWACRPCHQFDWQWVAHLIASLHQLQVCCLSLDLRWLRHRGTYWSLPRHHHERRHAWPRAKALIIRCCLRLGLPHLLCRYFAQCCRPFRCHHFIGNSFFCAARSWHWLPLSW